MSMNLLARLTGTVYLLLILTGIFSLVYVPSLLFDWQNVTNTIKNIRDNEFIFRLAVAAEIACFLLYILLPILFFKLLYKIEKNFAVLMVAFSTMSVPITLTHVAKHIDILTIIQKQNYLDGTSEAWLNEYVMLRLIGFNNGVIVSNILWGLWLLPLGFLVYKSKFLPKILGILLVMGCFGYLIEFIAKFIFSVKAIPWYISAPSSLGEFGICFWLLFFGARPNFFKPAKQFG